ncbi:hypothetical protein CBR_g368 [Chara braunii]|uniref:Rubisco LSMT substrate-binding domain-containing protein n=1 Tax=Chara braunii TaxID=69332 RepID=A0A388JQI4_CHABU|nr:hypothetical protein CBR_g368 [Chara braunii]|eukprot:GBG60037.1 hypothetical protein CBR_g368 [Chara braunii]
MATTAVQASAGISGGHLLGANPVSRSSEAMGVLASSSAVCNRRCLGCGHVSPLAPSSWSHQRQDHHRDTWRRCCGRRSSGGRSTSATSAPEVGICSTSRQRPGRRQSFAGPDSARFGGAHLRPNAKAPEPGAVVNATSQRQRELSSTDMTIDLKQWMEENGLPPSKVTLADRPCFARGQKPIHHVVASEDLQAGDTVLRVPLSLVVTLERVLGDETLAELLTTNKLSELACLALYLMYEKKRGKESFWYPYIRELDRQRGRGQLAVESPLLWSRTELNEYFAGSPTRHIFAERLEGIKREYQELDTVWFMAGSLFKKYPFDIPTEAFPFEIFRQAFVAVQSCVVHLQGVNLARRFALVPLGPPLLSYRSDSKAMLRADGDFVQLQVDRAYKAGEPIVVWCGPQPNAKLLLNYGYVDEDNKYDRLVLEAALNTEDPLYQKKRAIVQKSDRFTKQQFLIYRGKEREAVLDMLPYLRLAHITDENELDAFPFTATGTVENRVSECNDRAVVTQLSEFLKQRLGEYKTTVEEDDRLIANPNEDPKKVVAAKLLRIEKKMLIATLDAVKAIARELPPAWASPCFSVHAPILSL